MVSPSRKQDIPFPSGKPGTSSRKTEILFPLWKKTEISFSLRKIRNWSLTQEDQKFPFPLGNSENYFSFSKTRNVIFPQEYQKPISPSGKIYFLSGKAEMSFSHRKKRNFLFQWEKQNPATPSGKPAISKGKGSSSPLGKPENGFCL